MKGFTIIESIVALTIIIAAVIGPFTLITKGLISSKSAKNRLIASNLAQEGIEIIRYFRDSNVLSACVGPDGSDPDDEPDPDWRALTDTSNSCTPLSDSAINTHWETDATFDLTDSRLSRLTSISDGSERIIKFCRTGDNLGLYAYSCPNDSSPSSLLDTSFKRRIKLSSPGDETVCINPTGPLPCTGTSAIIPGIDRLKVDITILWQDGAISRNLTQTEILYNWR